MQSAAFMLCYAAEALPVAQNEAFLLMWQQRENKDYTGNNFHALVQPCALIQAYYTESGAVHESDNCFALHKCFVFRSDRAAVTAGTHFNISEICLVASSFIL